MSGDGWDDTRRCDGLAIMLTRNCGWVVLPVGQDMLGACPICVRPFRNRETAKLAADLLYPLDDSNEITAAVPVG